MKNLALILALVLIATPALASDKAPNETYDRVVKTRTLRCAYTIYPTFIEKDPKTGKFSGLFYDLTEEIGKELGLKIEWTDEVGTDALFESFKGNRADANCTGYFAMPPRAWGGDFTRPIVFIPFNLYVRANEKRFASFDDLNKSSIRFSTLDGELSQIVAAENFPLAQQVSLPGLTPATDRFMAVAGGKADATAMEGAIGGEFMAANPGKIKQLGNKPLRLGGSVIVIPHNEFELKRMLDTTIDTMLWTGTLERIVKQHEKYPGTMLLPALPYQPEAAEAGK